VGSVHADYSAESFTENEFFLIAEVLDGEGTQAAVVDESGWDGRVEEIDAASLDQYASNDGVFSRIDVVAAVATSAKSKCKPQSGIASWYGGSLHGSKTASGERFNTYAQADMTAAHKSLPMGTRVRVTNRKNGRSVIVRINDRGPFIRGRVIDVSQAAAKALHLDGVGPVELSCI
jgi:rare lipoprotein A